MIRGKKFVVFSVMVVNTTLPCKIFRDHISKKVDKLARVVEESVNCKIQSMYNQHTATSIFQIHGVNHQVHETI